MCLAHEPTYGLAAVVQEELSNPRTLSIPSNMDSNYVSGAALRSNGERCRGVSEEHRHCNEQAVEGGRKYYGGYMHLETL